MENREIDILNILDEDTEVTQRDIAKKTGMSLGMVNALIKKLVKKGLVKIERLNSRNLRYILTPKGIREKTIKTLSYIKRSYQAIIEISSRIRTITEKEIKEGKEIWVLGERDEIFGLVTSVLDEMQVKFKYANNPGEIMGQREKIVFYWNPEYQKENNAFFNILRVKRITGLKNYDE